MLPGRYSHDCLDKALHHSANKHTLKTSDGLGSREHAHTHHTHTYACVCIYTRDYAHTPGTYMLYIYIYMYTRDVEAVSQLFRNVRDSSEQSLGIIRAVYTYIHVCRQTQAHTYTYIQHARTSMSGE